MHPGKKELPDLDNVLRLAFEPESMQLLAGGETLTKKHRHEMLRQLRAGDVTELELDARVYRQSKTARPLPAAKRRECNANFVHFADPASLAVAFKGRPFLRDHDRGLLAAGGEIIESELVEDGDNWIAFQQKLSLKAPWAVEAALMGTLRTFSIAWQPKVGGMQALMDAMHCSCCAAPMFGGDCPHWPGDEVKLDGAGLHVIVELQWRNVIGRETSGVTFPAVQGTGIEAVRAALAEYPKNRREATMLSKIIAALSLAATATEEEALGALQEMKAKAVDADSLRARLSNTETLFEAEKEAHRTVASELADARKRYDELLEKGRKGEEDALVKRALDEGRMRPGQRAMEAAIRALAQSDMKAAKEYVDGMTRLDPIGGPPQTPTRESQARGPGAQLGMTEEQIKMAASVGLTPEQWRKHNPPDPAE
jgi:hypothetical protein